MDQEVDPRYEVREIDGIIKLKDAIRGYLYAETQLKSAQLAVENAKKLCIERYKNLFGSPLYEDVVNKGLNITLSEAEFVTFVLHSNGEIQIHKRVQL